MYFFSKLNQMCPKSDENKSEMVVLASKKQSLFFKNSLFVEINYLCPEK